jgi:hypothetical protein
MVFLTNFIELIELRFLRITVKSQTLAENDVIIRILDFYSLSLYPTQTVFQL